MLLPYRAKNPPERFPVATLVLIAINLAVFGLTSEKFLVVREEAVTQYAVSPQNLSLMTLLSSMFLHADLFHVASNMFFLWIFGASTEGRLKTPLFVVGYLLAGLGGGYLQEVVTAAVNPDGYSLGASGAVMGVAGMYLWLFPYSYICAVHREYWVVGWLTVSDIQARWVVLSYVGLDVLYQLLFQGKDGVGHLAHIGGAVTGLLFVMLLRTRRDSEEKSEAQAVRAEMKDFSLLSLNDLSALMDHPTDDMKLVMAYCEKAVLQHGSPHVEHALNLLRRDIKKIIEEIEPSRVAWVLQALPPQLGGVAPVYYLRIGSRIEALGAFDAAANIYRRMYDLYPTAPDTEAALYRLAKLMEGVYRNPQFACQWYSEMLRLFPHGQNALEVQSKLRQMSGPG